MHACLNLSGSVALLDVRLQSKKYATHSAELARAVVFFGDDLPTIGGGKANGRRQQVGSKIRTHSQERVDRQPSVFFGTI
jgi:hypothetical protein